MSHHGHFQDTNNFTHSSPGVKEVKLCTARILACENIRFSSLFVAEDEERGETDVFAGYPYLYNMCIIWTPGSLPLESASTRQYRIYLFTVTKLYWS